LRQAYATGRINQVAIFLNQGIAFLRMQLKKTQGNGRRPKTTLHIYVWVIFPTHPWQALDLNQKEVSLF